MLVSGPTPTTHFHMTNLYARDKEYRGWSVEHRAAYLKLAVDAARTHKFCGISVLFSQSDFERLAPPRWVRQYSSMYSASCQMVLLATALWIERHRTFYPVAYAFESGHRFWDEADGILRGIGKYPESSGSIAIARTVHSIRRNRLRHPFRLPAAPGLAPGSACPPPPPSGCPPGDLVGFTVLFGGLAIHRLARKGYLRRSARCPVTRVRVN
jgi:hypothetical protein